MRIEQSGGIVMYGYANEVMLISTITPPRNFTGTSAKIDADLNYLVCDDSCIQGSAKLTLNLPVGSSGLGNQAELFKTWQDRMPAAQGQTKEVANCRASAAITSTAANKSAGKVTIAIDWKGAPPSNIDWFPPARDGIQFGKLAIENAGKTTTITIPFERFGTKAETKLMESVVAYRSGGETVGMIVSVTATQ
jgi:DsbC/DsbD-like thiol-disulfide interchange protein